MAQAAVAVDVHKPLDIPLRLAAQRSFDLEIGGDDRPDFRYFIIIEFADTLAPVDPRLFEDALSTGSAKAVDVRQSYFSSLIFR